MQLVDLSIALATESKWLDFFDVPKHRRVLFITRKSSRKAISKRILRALTVTRVAIAELLNDGRNRIRGRPKPLPKRFDSDLIKGMHVTFVDVR